MKKSFLFLFFYLFTLQAVFAHSGSHNITLVYTGNIDGELEPCGCSEGGNKGGIKRRATAIEDLRKEDPKLYLISAGGIVTSEVPQDKLKSEYILKGLKALDYDAVGVQWQDLAYGEDFIVRSNLPFVVTNKQRGDFFSRANINHNHANLVFFNWLDPNKNPAKGMQESLVNEDKDKLLATLKAAKEAKQTTILSTTYTLEEAKTQFPLTYVDILIIKAKYEHYGEPQVVDKTLVLQPGSRGMRIGKLQMEVSKDGKILSHKHEIIPLPPEVVDSPSMQDWYDEYNAKVKADYEARVALRKTLQTGESPYAGEKVCEKCHAKEHEIWFDTLHAEAFFKLQDVNKAFDPNCIGCHTVGFEQPGGFIDPAITEHLQHVQCENCHGAGKAHADSMGQKPVANKDWKPEQMCAQCHVQKHSPDFDFKTYWPRIAHGKKQ